MIRKHKSSDTGNSNMPKRSYKVLPLSEKMKICHQNIWCIWGSIISASSGNPQVSWKVSLKDKGEQLCILFRSK
jgi:hypothetical protein